MPKAAAIVAFSLILASALPCFAGELPYGLDAYAGASGGYGSTTREQPGAPETTRTSNWSYGGYGGVGWHSFAAEAGWMELPHEHAYSVAENPHRSATSTLRGHAIFARGVIRAPLTWTLRPYAFAGVARLKVENHEMGQCNIQGTVCNASIHADYRETLTATRPYVGAGAELAVVGPLSLRAEFGFIPCAVVSAHVAKRDEYLGSVAVQLRF